MKRRTTIFVIIVLMIAVSCATKVSRSTHYPPVLVAWNEDTINSCQLTLLHNKTFHYAIIQKEDNERKVKGWGGTYKISADSIWLYYDKAHNTIGTTDYLVKEVSGKYLIQYFVNNSTKMYLRIQNPSH